MVRSILLRACLLGLLFLLVYPQHVAAQHRLQGTRAFVQSPQALGMGGTAVAYPSAQTAIFYNPAQLTQIRVSRTPVTLIGASASFSKNAQQQLDFYNDQLQPAIDRGIDNLSDAEEAALYAEAIRVGSRPTSLSGDLLLPSFAMNRGTFGVGGGLYAHSDVGYFVRNSEVPAIDFAAMADFMAVAAGAFDFAPVGLKGLSLGVTGKFAQRYLSVKAKPIDAFDEDESLYVLGASSVAMDLGVLYDARFVPGPGHLYLGFVLSDLKLSDFDYSFSAYYAKNEEVQNDAKIAGEVALAEARYRLTSTYRAGLSYVMPDGFGPLGETVVALDYVDYGDVFKDQPLLSRVNLGIQASLGSLFSVRGGLKQGYTTVGAGLQLPFVQVDYAYYGVEEGRLPGQAPSWHHKVTFILGSF